MVMSKYACLVIVLVMMISLISTTTTTVEAASASASASASVLVSKYLPQITAFISQAVASSNSAIIEKTLSEIAKRKLLSPEQVSSIQRSLQSYLTGQGLILVDKLLRALTLQNQDDFSTAVKDILNTTYAAGPVGSTGRDLISDIQELGGIMTEGDLTFEWQDPVLKPIDEAMNTIQRALVPGSGAILAYILRIDRQAAPLKDLPFP